MWKGKTPAEPIAEELSASSFFPKTLNPVLAFLKRHSRKEVPSPSLSRRSFQRSRMGKREGETFSQHLRKKRRS